MGMNTANLKDLTALMEPAGGIYFSGRTSIQLFADFDNEVIPIQQSGCLSWRSMSGYPGPGRRIGPCLEN